MKILDEVKIVCSLALLAPLCTSAQSFERRRISLFGNSDKSAENASYAPTLTTCPPAKGDEGFVRDAKSQKISKEEADYIQRHQKGNQQAWAKWLSSTNLNGNGGIAGGVAAYTSKMDNLPKVGIAVSGGGYRAMLHGSAVLKGLDGRDAVANQRGTGGFLQLASYVSGTSGGSWTVGGLAINDWPTIDTLAQNVWDLGQSLVLPTKDTFSYYSTMIQEVNQKEKAKFSTGITDYWGRGVSHHVLGASFKSHGAGTLFSDIRKTSNFKSASYPFPLVNADECETGDPLTGRNTTMYEFTPFEFGSWDPSVASFIPIDILGTNLNKGVSAQTDKQCISGFENFGWVLGTSAAHFKSLFSSFTSQLGALPAPLRKLLTFIASQPSDGSVVPNPFFGSTSASSVISSRKEIKLVDGGEDGQVIPVDHLLQPSRNLDMILAIDSSADVTGWPSGVALHETYLRMTMMPKFHRVHMPAIPTPETFIASGLNTRPVFFGCAASKVAAKDGTDRAPLIVYTANYPWSTMSNTSTFQFQYTPAQTQAILENGVNVATMGGLTKGATHWPTCLACASLQRSFERSGSARPKVCDACMEAYCWDGKAGAKEAGTTYAPSVGPPKWLNTAGASGSNGTITGAPGVIPGLKPGVSPKVTKGVYSGGGKGTTPGVGAGATHGVATGGSAPVAGVGSKIA